MRAQIVQNEEKRKFEAAKEFQDAVEAREIYKYNETLDKAFDKRQRYNQLCYGQELLKQRDDYDERKVRIFDYNPVMLLFHRPVKILQMCFLVLFMFELHAVTLFFIFI